MTQFFLYYLLNENLNMPDLYICDIVIWSSGTEFVVVEDSSCLDTNAIILKGTTVLTYKPRLLDRPFSGSLAGIEVTYSTIMAPFDAQTLPLRLQVLPVLISTTNLFIKESQS